MWYHLARSGQLPIPSRSSSSSGRSSSPSPRRSSSMRLPECWMVRIFGRASWRYPDPALYAAESVRRLRVHGVPAGILPCKPDPRACRISAARDPVCTISADFRIISFIQPRSPERGARDADPGNSIGTQWDRFTIASLCFAAAIRPRNPEYFPFTFRPSTPRAGTAETKVSLSGSRDPIKHRLQLHQAAGDRAG